MFTFIRVVITRELLGYRCVTWIRWVIGELQRLTCIGDKDVVDVYVFILAPSSRCHKFLSPLRIVPSYWRDALTADIANTVRQSRLQRFTRHTQPSQQHIFITMGDLCFTTHRGCIPVICHIAKLAVCTVYFGVCCVFIFLCAKFNAITVPLWLRFYTKWRFIRQY